MLINVNIFTILMLLVLKIPWVELRQNTVVITATDNNELEHFRPADEQTVLSATEYTVKIGYCKFAINRLCPDPKIRFYLFSKQHPHIPEFIRIGSHPFATNLTKSAFNPNFPTKLIIHGYNSDMDLAALVEIRKQYLASGKLFNIFFMDWAAWCEGPCYPAAIWNIRHVGLCASQLIERLREVGVKDIHVIGFSLGAHVTNFMALALTPYKVSRITGLDPAMPGFVTTNIDDKLDKSDAHFVDIIHTNGMMQGKIEECGHIDFYVNGGMFQPGCWAEERSFACNHHRAPLYFAESINSHEGFYGWPCDSYVRYLLGECLPKEPQIFMGEYVPVSMHGAHLVITNSVAPYAVGRFTKPAIEIFLKAEAHRKEIIRKFRKELEATLDEDSLIDATYKEGYYAKLLQDIFRDTLLYETGVNFTDLDFVDPVI